jgi:hypothetical protein
MGTALVICAGVTLVGAILALWLPSRVDELVPAGRVGS